MAYIGDIALGQTFDVKFTTRQISGAPFSLASGVISAYVGNGTTEITAGITLSADFDSRTGLNNVRVVATSGNGFATATDVQLVITTGTVNSISVVGEVIAEFSIENRQSNVKFWNGTAVATPATAGIPDVNVKNFNNLAAVALPLVPTVAGRTLDVSAGGEAGADWANIGSPTTAVNLSGTTVKTATDVEAKLPAALVGGKMESNIGSVTAGVIAAASFAANALDAVWSTAVRALTDKANFTLSAAYDPAKTAAQAGDAMTLTAGGYNAAADALLDRANAIETAWTVRRVLRIMSAAMGGKASGAATNTPVYRDITDTKDRITATTDVNGNRTAVTLDGT